MIIAKKILDLETITNKVIKSEMRVVLSELGGKGMYFDFNYISKYRGALF